MALLRFGYFWRFESEKGKGPGSSTQKCTVLCPVREMVKALMRCLLTNRMKRDWCHGYPLMFL